MAVAVVVQPQVVAVAGPEVHDLGVREQRDVDRVVRVVVAQEHVRDGLRRNPEAARAGPGSASAGRPSPGRRRSGHPRRGRGRWTSRRVRPRSRRGAGARRSSSQGSRHVPDAADETGTRDGRRPCHPPPMSNEHADLVLTGGRIFTGDAARSLGAGPGRPRQPDRRRGRGPGREAARRPRHPRHRAARPDRHGGLPGRPRPPDARRVSRASGASSMTPTASTSTCASSPRTPPRTRTGSGSSGAAGRSPTSRAAFPAARTSTASSRTDRSSSPIATATTRGSTRGRSSSPGSRGTRRTRPTGGSPATRTARRWARCTRGR